MKIRPVVLLIVLVCVTIGAVIGAGLVLLAWMAAR